MDTGGGPGYTIVKVGERSNGGLREMTAEEGAGNVRPAWIPYFAVHSTDDSAARAAEAGGRVLGGPIDLPNGGRIAALADPQGAAFAVSSGLPLDD
jgi:predicted enzyme related to lactoylglutathione lyase